MLRHEILAVWRASRINLLEVRSQHFTEAGVLGQTLGARIKLSCRLNCHRHSLHYRVHKLRHGTVQDDRDRIRRSSQFLRNIRHLVTLPVPKKQDLPVVLRKSLQGARKLLKMLHALEILARRSLRVFEQRIEPDRRIREGSTEVPLTPQVALRPPVIASRIGDTPNQRSAEPLRDLACGTPLEIRASLVGLDERLLHDIRRVDPPPELPIQPGAGNNPEVIPKRLNLLFVRRHGRRERIGGDRNNPRPTVTERRGRCKRGGRSRQESEESEKGFWGDGVCCGGNAKSLIS